MASRSRNDRQAVVIHSASAPRSHTVVTLHALARKLADILRCNYGGHFEPGSGGTEALYHLPQTTFVGPGRLSSLGIVGEEGFFGGAVTWAHSATKAIVHPCVTPLAEAPEGWSDTFAERVRAVALPGYTAFGRKDVLEAGARLAAHGRLRVKPVDADGGRDQAVVPDMGSLRRLIADMPETTVSRGLVIECNLDRPTTMSVGRVRVGTMAAAYVGTQQQTSNNRGETAYGGSRLFVVRGGFDELLRHPLPTEARLAIHQARSFDEAADASVPGLVASRRNYDVAQGVCASGIWRSGVLEQSWRSGGATAAELLAIETFLNDDSISAVNVRTIETYGESPHIPDGAFVHFAGEDDEVGALAKYAVIEEVHHAR